MTEKMLNLLASCNVDPGKYLKTVIITVIIIAMIMVIIIIIIITINPH